MRNTLVDLHNILMEQLERLNDDELTDEEFERELKRSKGIAKVGSVMVQNTANIIEAAKIQAEYNAEPLNKSTANLLIGKDD